MSVTEFLQQLRQSTDIDYNYFKVWTHDLIASWLTCMSSGEGPSVFTVHEQGSALVVFYLLCEHIKAHIDEQQSAEQFLEGFFEWIRENSIKVSPESDPWDRLLLLLNKESQVIIEPSSVNMRSGFCIL